TSNYGQDAGYGTLIPLGSDGNSQSDQSGQSEMQVQVQDNGTSIIDLPTNQSAQVPDQPPSGESSNPSDYHPSQAITVPGANASTTNVPPANGAPANAASTNEAPANSAPPLPSSAAGLNQTPAPTDNSSDVPVPTQANTPPPPAPAPADSSQGLY